MPTGIPFSYSPGAKFAFPRSYFARIVVTDDTPNIIRVGNFFKCTIDATLGYNVWYELDSRIFAWSSNRYTLDFPVIDCWWEYGFDGIHHPQYYSVNWIYYGTPLLPCLEIRDTFAAFYSVEFPVQQAPSGYWLPAYPP